MYRRHESNLGYHVELEKLYSNDKCLINKPEKIWRTQGKGTSGEPTRPNTDVLYSGGSIRSSVEASVMEVERRDWQILHVYILNYESRS